LDCTIDQRATRAPEAGTTATARPARAVGVRSVAPAKDDTKPIMVGLRWAAKGKGRERGAVGGGEKGTTSTDGVA